MESSFDNQLRKKLEDIRPEEAGVSFDRERIWEKINSRSPKKVLPLRTWITHAAAVVIGILIAGYFFSRHDNPTTTPANFASKDVPVKSEPTKKVPDVNVEPAISTPVLVKQNQVIPPSVHQQPEKTPESPSPVLVYEPVPAGAQESLAQAKPQKSQSTPKILHLADMDNENGAHQYAESRPESLLAKLAGRGETKEQDTEMLSALISNYVTNKKFK